MSTWNSVTEMGGINLLPEGTRTFEITTARVATRTNRDGLVLRELTVGLSSSEGSGTDTVALDPFVNTPDGIQLWQRIFKTAAVGLGFQPSNGDAPISDVVQEFIDWVPGSGLVGCHVEAEVTHHNSTKLKDDGTPFVNHRVKYRGIVQGTPAAPAAVAQQQAVPSFAGAGADTMQDPWA